MKTFPDIQNLELIKYICIPINMWRILKENGIDQLLVIGQLENDNDQHFRFNILI